MYSYATKKVVKVEQFTPKVVKKIICTTISPLLLK